MHHCNLGEFDFSFDAAFMHISGLDFNTQLSATHNGVPIGIQYYQPSELQNGSQMVSGRLDLNNPAATDSICFVLTAELNGVQCVDSICASLPPDLCSIVPDFTFTVDPVTCVVTFISTSIIDSCTYVDPSDYHWKITAGGSIYQGVGKTVSFSNLAHGRVEVCLQVIGYNYSMTNDCHPEICRIIEIPECNCADCADPDLLSAQWVNFYPGTDSCFAEVKLILQRPEGESAQIGSVVSNQGQVNALGLSEESSTFSTYQFEFQPTAVWEGGEVCFDVFVKTENDICKYTICLDIPSCEEEQAMARKKLLPLNEDFSSLHIYPNPTNRNIYVKWDKASQEKAIIQLQDLSGKKIMLIEHALINTLLELDLDHLAEGIYILHIQQKDAVIRQKIVLIK